MAEGSPITPPLSRPLLGREAPSPPRTASPASPATRRRRVRGVAASAAVAIAAILGVALLASPALRSNGLWPLSPAYDDITLLSRSDRVLVTKIRALAASGHYLACNATHLRPRHGADIGRLPSDPSRLAPRLLKLPSTTGAIKGNHFVELIVEDAPCWGVSGCCHTNLYLRPGDAVGLAAFAAAFQHHEASVLYSLFAASPPKYVLEGGAGAGFGTALFKALWPRAVVVAVEPDPGNYEAMVLNTREIDGVHAVHGGLWPYHAMLRQRKRKGHRVLEELPPGRGGAGVLPRRRQRDILGLSVQNLMAMFDVPAFDFVYLDVEGSEAAVLSSAADLGWLSTAKVIAIKLQEPLGRYFGVKDRLTARVSAAFIGRDFHVVDGGVHLVLIAREALAAVPGLDAAAAVVGGGGLAATPPGGELEWNEDSVDPTD